MKCGTLDYLRYYDLEAYLFEDVRKRFQKEGVLSAFDFFSIVIWKANRAKSKVAHRLLKMAETDDLDGAVRQHLVNLQGVLPGCSRCWARGHSLVEPLLVEAAVSIRQESMGGDGWLRSAAGRA